jgi:hypothetical protein
VAGASCVLDRRALLHAQAAAASRHVARRLASPAALLQPAPAGGCGAHAGLPAPATGRCMHPSCCATSLLVTRAGWRCTVCCLRPRWCISKTCLPLGATHCVTSGERESLCTRARVHDGAHHNHLSPEKRTSTVAASASAARPRGSLRKQATRHRPHAVRAWSSGGAPRCVCIARGRHIHTHTHASQTRTGRTSSHSRTRGDHRAATHSGIRSHKACSCTAVHS